MGLQQKFKTTTDSLEMIYYWYEPYHKIGCIFFLVWDLVSMALLSPVLIPLFKGEIAFPRNIFALCSFIVMVPAPTYWMLLFVMNKTRVYLSKSKITVINGPLPSMRKNQSFMLCTIKCIYIKKHRQNALFDDAWHIKADETCSVKAIMKNGESKYIFQNVQSTEDARIAYSRINLWLKELNRAELHDDQLRTHTVLPHPNPKLNPRSRNNNT